MKMISRRNLVGAGTALAGTMAAPAVARAQVKRWRMVTSWPRKLPGPGMSADRVQHLERGHHFACGVNRDLQLAAG